MGLDVRGAGRASSPSGRAPGVQARCWEEEPVAAVGREMGGGAGRAVEEDKIGEEKRRKLVKPMMCGAHVVGGGIRD